MLYKLSAAKESRKVWFASLLKNRNSMMGPRTMWRPVFDRQEYHMKRRWTARSACTYVCMCTCIYAHSRQTAGRFVFTLRFFRTSETRAREKRGYFAERYTFQAEGYIHGSDVILHPVPVLWSRDYIARHDQIQSATVCRTLSID